MTESSDLRTARMPLHNGAGQMPVLGFGTLIPDPAVTKLLPETRWKRDFATSIVPSDTRTSAKSARR